MFMYACIYVMCVYMYVYIYIYILHNTCIALYAIVLHCVVSRYVALSCVV